MEVLAGARSDDHLEQLRALMMVKTPSLWLILATQASTAQTHSRFLYCRWLANREKIRKLIDCLIAAIAMRNEMQQHHQVAGFDTLQRHSALKVR